MTIVDNSRSEFPCFERQVRASTVAPCFRSDDNTDSQSGSSSSSSCGRRGRTLGRGSTSTTASPYDPLIRRCIGDTDPLSLVKSPSCYSPLSNSNEDTICSFKQSATTKQSVFPLSLDRGISTSGVSTNTGGGEDESVPMSKQQQANVTTSFDDTSAYSPNDNNSGDEGSPYYRYSPSTAPSFTRDIHPASPYKIGHASPFAYNSSSKAAPISSAPTPMTDTTDTKSSSDVGAVAAMVISILMYTTISLAIVYFNWWLFTGSFRYPIFVSWIQQVFGLFLFVLLALLGQKGGLSFLKHFPLMLPRWHTMRRVAPLSLAFVGMVGLANLCLKYVQVSTYQVARSLTLFFTLVLSWVMLGDAQSRRIVLACSIMVIGFIIGSTDTKTLSFTGLLAGASSSLFQAIYNVAIKSTLQRVDGDPNILLFYNLCLSCFLFLPLVILFGEADVVQQLRFDFANAAAWSQWGSLFCSGFLATAMNLSSYFCVKCTSPLTFNIVGFTKSIFQTMGGFLFLGDLVSAPSLVGVTLSLGGSGLYSWYKIQEMGFTSSSSNGAAGLQTTTAGGAAAASASDGATEDVELGSDFMVEGGEGGSSITRPTLSGELLYPLPFPSMMMTKRHSMHDTVEEEIALLHSTLTRMKGAVQSDNQAAMESPSTVTTAPSNRYASPVQASP